MTSEVAAGFIEILGFALGMVIIVGGMTFLCTHPPLPVTDPAALLYNHHVRTSVIMLIAAGILAVTLSCVLSDMLRGNGS